MLWGDGTPTREFLHVRDAARGIVLAAERYGRPEPVNIGSGQEITMRALAAVLQRVTRFNGVIEWDATKPNGQPRRCLDTGRAEKEFSFKAEVPLAVGLRETVEWYESQTGALRRAA